MSTPKQVTSILVIEDDAGDFNLIKANAWLSGLVSAGDSEPITWARTLAEGISQAKSSKPDIILLDLSLPDSSGLATVQTMFAAVTNIPIVVLTGNDDNAHIQWANPAFTNLTGYSLDEALGRKPGELIKSGSHDPAFYRKMWETLMAGVTWYGEIINRRKDGSLYNQALTITPITKRDNSVQYFVAIMQDITSRTLAEEKINKLAFYDALTMLPNRRLLNDRMEQAMIASKRNGYYGALMLMDLDNFKPLNDAHGHAAGDLLLVEVAQRITGCLRETDTVARLGGDEFVVMLSKLSVDKEESVLEAGVIAEKIRTTLSTPYLLKIQHEDREEKIVEHHCSASIGVALFHGHDVSPGDIIKCADTAMYKAKMAGRNSIRFYEDSIYKP